MVVPVPDSGVPAALGYAAQSGIPFKYGIRPLSLGKLKSGGYIVASETCAFDLVGAEFIRDVNPGEMLVFSEDTDEPESIQLFEAQFRPCAFEYVYFARPDSVIDGKNVYTTRENMGKL